MKYYPYISELMVLKSPAGFYAGRVLHTGPSEFEPYSRESSYYQIEDCLCADLEKGAILDRMDSLLNVSTKNLEYEYNEFVNQNFWELI